MALRRRRSAQPGLAPRADIGERGVSMQHDTSIFREWCQFNGITPDFVTRLNAHSPMSDLSYPMLPTTPFVLSQANAAKENVLRLLTTSLERNTGERAKTVNRIHFDLAPRADKPERPFATATMDGTVLVSLHYHGRPQDFLALAHETAHAVQLLHAPEGLIPPIYRETAAFLGELIVLNWWKAHYSANAELLRRAHAAENRHYIFESSKHIDSNRSDCSASG